MNSELEKAWKETVVGRYTGIYLDGLRKTMKNLVRIAGLRTEI
jgi:hypothetical protein